MKRPKSILQIRGQQGFILYTVLAMIVVLSIVIGSVGMMIAVNVSGARQNEMSQRAFNAAEAGANYYLWHLSHNTSDFKDGNSTPATPDATLGYGPYTHNYVDTNGRLIGTYTLWINPQGNGSTIAKVRSIGKATSASGTSTRTIEVKIGAPSYASYGLIADGQIWFGSTESASGPVHTNSGVRLDGASDSDVTSSRATYVPSSSLGGNGSTSRPGVWCDSSVTTPVNCNTRSKVDWRYPVPSIDFNQLSADLCTLKKQAFSSDASTASLATQANACTQVPTSRTPGYLPQTSTTGTYSATRGYLITLNNNDTYDIESVTAVNDTLTPYTSALTRSSVATGVAVPANDVIFVEDNVWIRTATNYNGRVTIASGRLATSSNTNITVADDVLYQYKDGSNVIGLVAEGSFYIAPYAIPSTGNFDFEVDAAVIAQSGDAAYTGFTYNSNTNKCSRGWSGASQKFLFYGSVATRGLWTWTYSQGSSSCADAVSDGKGGYVSGVLNNTTQYDYNLLYGPPPYFPITSTYNILEWREVVTTP